MLQIVIVKSLLEDLDVYSYTGTTYDCFVDNRAQIVSLTITVRIDCAGWVSDIIYSQSNVWQH